MTVYFIVKYLHVLGAIVILGTGTCIAFFMLMAHLSRDAAFIARTAARGGSAATSAGVRCGPAVWTAIGN